MSRNSLQTIACACLMLILIGCESARQDVGDMMGTLIPPSPGEAARDLMDQYDADKRREAVLLLANAPFGGEPAYMAYFRDMVDNERDPTALAAAIRAVARHGAVEDAERIARHLDLERRHENRHVRWEAAKGLQRVHNPIAVVPLRDTLLNTDEHSSVRREAAIALGQYPEHRVIAALIDALDAPELSVALAANDSLELLTGVVHDPDPVEWFFWYSGTIDTESTFNNQQSYLFPTYQRKDNWLDYITFWSSNVWEHPAPPVGLTHADKRSTYPEDESGDQGSES